MRKARFSIIAREIDPMNDHDNEFRKSWSVSTSWYLFMAMR